jgi:hypothetical protein
MHEEPSVFNETPIVLLAVKAIAVSPVARCLRWTYRSRSAQRR